MKLCFFKKVCISSDYNVPISVAAVEFNGIFVTQPPK